MKIDLKLKPEEILFLKEQLIYMQSISVVDFVKKTVEQKLSTSILIEVADTFVSKAKSIIRKTSLFDQEKKYKVSLSYHHAFFLLKYLNDVPISHDFDQMLQRKIINQLDPKLK